MKNWKNFLLIALVAFMSAGGAVHIYSKHENPQQQIEVMQPAALPVQYASYSGAGAYVDLTYAAETSVNAVVHVMTKYDAQEQTVVADPLFEFFFKDRGGSQQPYQQQRIGSGSGVIISSDGYIVTNNHVIEGSKEITVALNDKRTYKATLVGSDPSTDLALLKVDALNLPTLAIGNSDELKVGEWVLAVGNPFNLTSTVTAGIVSAKARSINILTADMKIESFIQTDAAVNPGNSGGALVNMRGELIGINTAIASQTGSYAGYAFAVPVSIVSKIVADLKQFGVVQRALLGIVINDINADFAKEKNINVLEGIYVSDVNSRGAAMDAGIQKGDIITHVNNVKVKSVSELQEQIGRLSPGDKVKVQAIRNNKNREFDVVLKNKMGNTSVMKEVSAKDLGANLVPLSESQKRTLGVSSGVKVDQIDKDGKLAKAGIDQGYIILKINNTPVHSVLDVASIVEDVKLNSNEPDEQALFITGINPNGKVAYYAVDLS